MVIAACAAVVCAGAALAVLDGVSASGSTKADDTTAETANTGKSKAKASPSAAKTADAETETALSSQMAPEVLLDRASGLLRELMSSPSRRIERLATMALARTGDAEALKGLATLLENEKSSLNQIALAYALARSGDAKGRAILVDGLTHDRRDVRTDAAIALLNLGDDAGRATLNRMTNLRHFKISACEHLARAGDEKAKIQLEKVYNDPTEDAETRLRAAVALGRAGDATVSEFLRSTLADGRFQVGAADALATLGDKASVAPLTTQLELNAMRVRAALALRRLGVKVDLDTLAVALTEDDEVTRVTAAEAILILTGPKELATRD